MNSALFSHTEDMNKVVLPGGATLCTQVVPDALSVSLGVWVRSGSRDEQSGEHGITHFLEHMVFKGTETRSALDIALAMDRLGGQLDAFTTKELTCFSSRVVAEHFDTALDVLGDLLTRPLLGEEMLATEKQVVLEEIRNVLDDPDDLIHDLASAEVFGSHPLGRPILGTEASVSGFQREQLHSYLESRYATDNIIVAVAGPLPHDDVVERVSKAFRLRSGNGLVRSESTLAPVAKRVRVESRDLQQQHLWLGRLGLGYSNPDRYAMLLLSTLLGGSMSSRLFQAIRERAGLAYSVFSFADFASDAGLLATYMAVSPARTGEAIRHTLDEYVGLISKGCTEEELENTKMQLKGNLLLAMESVTARMNRLARNEIHESRFIGVEELVERIDSVTTDDIRRLAASYLDPETLTLVSLGPAPETGPF